METRVATKYQNSSNVEKSQTCFLNDAWTIPRYSLADTAVETETGMDYHVRIVTIEDKFRALKFLRRFFFRDEPLNHSIELIPTGEDSTCEELEEYCSADSFDNNLSVMAVSTNGSIVGIMLNGISHEIVHTDEEPDFIKECENPKFKKILRLLHHVDMEVHSSGKFRDRKTLEVKIISVDSNWRGKGIAKSLMEKSLEIAREQGCRYARADCTSFYSGKLCEKYGFKKEYELKFNDYLDENGVPVFSPAPPHSSVTSYVKPL